MKKEDETKRRGIYESERNGKDKKIDQENNIKVACTHTLLVKILLISLMGLWGRGTILNLGMGALGLSMWAWDCGREWCGGGW